MTVLTELQAPHVMPEGMIFDYITGKLVKDNAKEQVRQRMARAIVQEYGVSVADMAPDFPVPVDGKRRRVVIVKPEPAKKGAGILRTHEQADKDLKELEDLLTATPKARYGPWTNGLELFFVERHATKFEDTFSPIGEWVVAAPT